MSEPIKFDATLAKVQSMADDGIRIYLDLKETDVLAMTALQTAKIHGAYFRIEATPIIQEISNTDIIEP